MRDVIERRDGDRYEREINANDTDVWNTYHEDAERSPRSRTVFQRIFQWRSDLCDIRNTKAGREYTGFWFPKSLSFEFVIGREKCSLKKLKDLSIFGATAITKYSGWNEIYLRTPLQFLTVDVVIHENITGLFEAVRSGLLKEGRNERRKRVKRDFQEILRFYRVEWCCKRVAFK